MSSKGFMPVLAIVWFLWSGHTAPFMLTLGGLSCAIVLGVCHRMGILDAEGVPIDLGLGPLWYAPWLIGQVFWSNVDVARRVLSSPLRIAPATADVPADRTSCGCT